MSDAPLNNRDLERVITRARELDALGRPQTRDALHQVAAQLNISPAAIDRALAEVLAGEASDGAVPSGGSAGVPTRGSTPRLHPWLTAASVTIGTVAGLLTGGSYDVRGGDNLTMAAIVLLFAVSAGIVWLHRDDRKPLTMIARMAALWSSFGYAWAIGFGELLSWFLDTTLIAAGASLVAGTVAHFGRRAWLRLRARSGEPTSSPRTMRDVFTPVPGPYHTPV